MLTRARGCGARPQRRACAEHIINLPLAEPVFTPLRECVTPSGCACSLNACESLVRRLSAEVTERMLNETKNLVWCPVGRIDNQVGSLV
jgi:hypothetical protein